MTTPKALTVDWTSTSDVEDLACDRTLLKHVLKAADADADGASRPTSGAKVFVHYSGYANDVKFDSSRDRKEPFSFLLGAGVVIPGWERAVRSMRKGERAAFKMAPQWAYGDRGFVSGDVHIEPNATLVFDISLLSFAAPTDAERASGIIELAVSRGADQIRFDNMHLTYLPSNIGRLRDVKLIHLDNNELRGLPEEFGELRALEHLSLNVNALERLPDSFGKLTRLAVLYLNQNKLSWLPSSFRQLTALQWLNLSDNPMKQLPSVVSSLTKLTLLSIEHTGLTSLPAERAFFAPLRELRLLMLNRNPLEQLPDSLGALRRLELLDVTGCPRLHSLPARALVAGCPLWQSLRVSKVRGDGADRPTFAATTDATPTTASDDDEVEEEDDAGGGGGGGGGDTATGQRGASKSAGSEGGSESDFEDEEAAALDNREVAWREPSEKLVCRGAKAIVKHYLKTLTTAERRARRALRKELRAEDAANAVPATDDEDDAT